MSVIQGRAHVLCFLVVLVERKTLMGVAIDPVLSHLLFPSLLAHIKDVQINPTFFKENWKVLGPLEVKTN